MFKRVIAAALVEVLVFIDNSKAQSNLPASGESDRNAKFFTSVYYTPVKTALIPVLITYAVLLLAKQRRFFHCSYATSGLAQYLSTLSRIKNTIALNTIQFLPSSR
jgi:hypothetical protein